MSDEDNIIPVDVTRYPHGGDPEDVTLVPQQRAAIDIGPIAVCIYAATLQKMSAEEVAQVMNNLSAIFGALNVIQRLEAVADKRQTT